MARCDMSSTRVNKEDSELFRETVGPVQPIVQDTILNNSRKIPPYPKQFLADEELVLAEMANGAIDPASMEMGDEILFKRPGVQDRVLQKLRRGKYSIEAVLDLHGMTVTDANSTLLKFISQSQNAKRQCIRVIHGKGRGSKDGKPVLKNKLCHWLQQRDEVLAFCSARPMDGGTGAMYILIRRA